MSVEPLQAVELVPSTCFVDPEGNRYTKLSTTDAAENAKAVRGVVVTKNREGLTKKTYGFYTKD